MAKSEYVGFWARFLAYILDIIILGIPAGIINMILLISGLDSLTSLVSIGMIVLVIWMEGTKGGTPGKLVLGYKIVNNKGKFIGIPGAILRYLGKIVSGLILGIGFLMIGLTEKKQGLHDKIANCYVVRK